MRYITSGVQAQARRRMSWADMVSSTQSGSFIQCLALAEGQHLRAKSQTPPNFHFSGCLVPRTQLGLRLFI